MKKNVLNKASSVNIIIVIIGFMLLARMLGLVRDAIMAQKMGLDAMLDAYSAGMYLTVNLFLGFGSAFTSSLIPIVVRHGKSNRGYEFINRLMSLLLLGCTIVVAAYWILAPYVVKLYLPVEKTTADIQLTTSVTRFMIPAIGFICLTYFMQGILQANEKFLMPAMMSLPSNLLFFLYLFVWLPDYGVEGLAMVTTFGWLLQLLFLLIPVVRHKLVRFRWQMRLDDPEVKSFFMAIIPITVITLTHYFNFMYDVNRSGAFGEGYAAATTLGSNLFKAVAQTTVYGITAVMFPKFNKRFVEDNRSGLNQSVINVLRSIMLLLIPMSIGLYILGGDMITFFYERGVFDAEDAKATIMVFTGYATLMIAFGVVDVLNKAYYTVGNRRTPLAVTGIITVSNIIITGVLTGMTGYWGVPMGTAAAYFIGASFSLILFVKGSDRSSLRRLAGSFVRSLIAALIMGSIVFLLRNIMITGLVTVSSLGLIFIIIAAAAIIYGILLILFREELVTYNVQQLYSRIRRR